MPDTFTLIAASTVGSGGAASIDFTSIPSTYTDLCLKYSIRGTNASAFINCSLTINGSSTDFSQRALQGNGSSATSFSRTDNLNMILSTASTATSNTFASADIYIPNYAGSTNKSFSIDDVSEQNATEAYAQLHAGLRANTAAITSIGLATQSGNFAQHSTAYLYGIVKS